MNAMSLAAIFVLSPETVIIIVVGLVVLFGAKKIPELMKGMGQGVKEFKKGLAEGAEDEKKDDEKKDDDKKDEKK